MKGKSQMRAYAEGYNPGRALPEMSLCEDPSDTPSNEVMQDTAQRTIQQLKPNEINLKERKNVK
jgi:hypothetical protein